MVQFNPITYAQEVSAAHKKLSVTTRREGESYSSYVNRFEAATTELESLVGPTQGLAEQHLVFQLLDGAGMDQPVYLQILSNCVSDKKNDAKPERVVKASEILKGLVEKTTIGGDLPEPYVQMAPPLTHWKTAILDSTHRSEVKVWSQRVTAAISKLETRITPTIAAGIKNYHAVEVSMESAKRSIRALNAADRQAAVEEVHPMLEVKSRSKQLSGNIFIKPS